MLLVAVAGLVVGGQPAFAAGPTEDDKHASCTTRDGPEILYKGETWLDYRDDGKGSWLVTNVQVKIRSINASKVNGDNHMTVGIHDFTKGGLAVRYHEFDGVPDSNGYMVLQQNVWPWLTVPKGKLSVDLKMITGIKRWPQNCAGAAALW